MTIVAEFKIDYRQILDPEGCLVAPLPRFAANPDEAVKMYEAMTRVRVFDTKAVNLQRTGQLGTYPPSLGHEATQIGVGAAMRPEDVLAPVYREFGTQLWRGVTMTEILTYWGGDERGNDFAGARHDFAWCVPIATQTLHAAGAAMAFKVRREPRCALAYIGDGGTSEGAFYEALNLAGARALPVVFMIVNNGWAISVARAEQTASQAHASCLRSFGRRRLKELPRPGSLSTRISPLWRWMMEKDTDSPSPVPTSPLVVKNGSKMRLRTCSGMPTPVSATVSTTCSSPSGRV